MKSMNFKCTNFRLKFQFRIPSMKIKPFTFLLFNPTHAPQVAGCFWFLVGESFEEHYGASWLSDKMPVYNVDPGYPRNTMSLFGFCDFSDFAIFCQNSSNISLQFSNLESSCKFSNISLPFRNFLSTFWQHSRLTKDIVIGEL